MRSTFQTIGACTAIGIAIGVGLGNIALGVIIGVAIGAAAGPLKKHFQGKGGCCD